jgi:glycosyltransferase involved in cell wall biosynthesis
VFIRNPIAGVYFRSSDRNKLREGFGVDSKAFVALAVANNLSDSNKNISLAIRSLEGAASQTSRKIVLLLVGQKGHGFKSESVDIRHLGTLDPPGLADAYTASDLLLSTSKTESAGMTVIESAACGTPCLVLSNGGSDEFVKNGKIGHLVNSEQEFDRALENIVSGKIDIGQLAQSARQSAKLHESSAVARAYLEVYSNLLAIS